MSQDESVKREAAILTARPALSSTRSVWY